MVDGRCIWLVMPTSSQGIANKMSPITVSIEVDRSAEEVFAYATDPSRFSEWQRGVVSGQMNSVGAPKVGDRCVTTRRIGFAERPATAELVRFDPPHHWGVRGVDGPIRAMVDVTAEPRSDSSAHLTIALDFEGHGIGRLLVPLLVRGEARREMPVNMATLKQRLEGSVRGDPSRREENGAADSPVPSGRTHFAPKA
jgi:uncharacterized protein YndB with AHSA1/START domain